MTPSDATATVPRGWYWRFQRDLRYRLMKLVLWLIVHAYLRFRFEGRERLPAPPYVLCFNHLDWADPLILVAVLPSPRRILTPSLPTVAVPHLPRYPPSSYV